MPRRKPITADDIANTPVQHLAAEEHTKGSYMSYMTPFFQFAVEKRWTSPKYWDEIHKKETVTLTPQYVQENNIKPICSSNNIEIFINEHMDKHGRRRGKGPCSRSIVDQFMKAAQYYRLREFSCNLYMLQTQEWRMTNLEFANKSFEVLRNRTILGLLEGFSKRQHRDEQLRYVDKQQGKRNLTGHEQLLEARWSFETGTDQAVRTHSLITLSRSVAYRVQSSQDLKYRHMKYDIAGSVAAGLPEIPALLLCPDDSKENHTGAPEVTGMIPHTNPLLCGVGATGQSIVLQFHRHLWNREPPDFSRRERWFNMHFLCTFENRNSHNRISASTLSSDISRMFTEALRWSEDRVKRELKGICNHLGRCTNAGETSDANVSDRQGDRIGGWASREHSRRDTSYLSHRIAFAAARALAGTPGNDMTAPHRLDHIPNAVLGPPLASAPRTDIAPESIDDILPSVPMQFVGEWVPFLPEWNERLKNEEDEVWSQQGSDDSRISATNFVRAGIFSVKVYICIFSVLREQYPANKLFKTLWRTMSDPFKKWCDENKQRWEASCETTQVTRALEEMGRAAEARALRSMESHMQIVLEAHKSTKCELIKRIEQSEHQIIEAVQIRPATCGNDETCPASQIPDPPTFSSGGDSRLSGMPPIPYDRRSAQTFVPTLDDLDKFTSQTKRGWGCEAVFTWIETKGRAIVESLGESWWQDIPGISKQIKNNVLAKRWKRIHDVLDLMGGPTRATLQKAKDMDMERNIRYPDMKLSTWAELKISAHTTITTAKKYQDFIIASYGPDKSREWNREANAILELLSDIISKASEPLKLSKLEGRIKLTATEDLNELEPRICDNLGVELRSTPATVCPHAHTRTHTHTHTHTPPSPPPSHTQAAAG